jgi:methionine synthase I (cobalamin-dependent)
MTERALLDRLVDPGRIVLFDGAMGTMLYQRTWCARFIGST